MRCLQGVFSMQFTCYKCVCFRKSWNSRMGRELCNMSSACSASALRVRRQLAQVKSQLESQQKRLYGSDCSSLGCIDSIRDEQAATPFLRPFRIESWRSEKQTPRGRVRRQVFSSCCCTPKLKRCDAGSLMKDNVACWKTCSCIK